jgi:hypothetical protein
MGLYFTQMGLSGSQRALSVSGLRGPYLKVPNGSIRLSDGLVRLSVYPMVPYGYIVRLTDNPIRHSDGPIRVSDDSTTLSEGHIRYQMALGSYQRAL